MIVSVEDTGCGMSLEAIQRIFEPFFTTKPHGIGTGIGLALCRKIVDTHCGRIWAESTPGSGSQFAFTIGERPDEALR